MTERVGGWMQTVTGGVFWPLDPRPEEIHLEDIAHALSLLCRYNGHCRDFYSVAQHSVLVAMALPTPLKLWGLLHDASEAYLSDIVRPVKPFIPGYREMEDRIMAAVCERFGLPTEMPAEVKRVDNAILDDERRCLMAEPPVAWGLTEPPLGIRIDPWPPKLAKKAFLARAEEYLHAAV